MKIQNYSGQIIPGRWFRLLLVLGCAGAMHAQSHAPASTPHPHPSGDLSSLVRSWRESPTPARRAAIESYANLHPKDEHGALARLALGVGSFEQKDYTAAVASLGKVQVPQLADYVGYYLAGARVESKDFDGAFKQADATHTTAVASPLAGRAWLVQARTLISTDAPAAVKLLRDHYNELPQPDGDVTLADCYQAANQLPQAADFYQRVYYQYVNGDAANRATAALITLRDTMGASYPHALPEQALHRADRLMELREYSRARAEYQTIAESQAALPREQAKVRLAAIDYLSGKTSAAYSALRALDPKEPEAAAERWYYIAECARRVDDESELTSAIQHLKKDHAKSPWRAKALITAANHHLVMNHPDDYVPLYRAIYEDFPSDPMSGLAHWKVTFEAYLHSKSEVTSLLRDHLKYFPTHSTAVSALYFSGRHFEDTGDRGAARACYQKLTQTFQNYYYAMVTRERLARPEIAGATVSAETISFLNGLNLAEPKPVPSEESHATEVRIERSRLLRTAGLSDLADAELRFGSRTDGQPALLAIEIAQAADAPHQALRIMKYMAPDYLTLTFSQAPRKFWELLFPLPYRNDLVQYARTRQLDPFLVAGLIRQESEFNPGAKSPANAYGLTQVRPGTGRQFARVAGIPRFTNRMLLQPAANLNLGTSILRSMLDHNAGSLEETLASYNAGPNRVAEWLTWNRYREPAEFVESIPFTETRDYVQAVLRNADIYRRLYQ